MEQDCQDLAQDQVQTKDLGLSRTVPEHVPTEPQESVEQRVYQDSVDSKAYNLNTCLSSYMHPCLVRVPTVLCFTVELIVYSCIHLILSSIRLINMFAIHPVQVICSHTLVQSTRLMTLFRSSKSTGVYMMFPKTEGYSDQYGTCSSKVPPSWDPSWDKQYPFHIYCQDVMLWISGVCELDDHQRGPAIAMRLQGVAREIVRELDLNTLMHGRMMNGNNGQPVNQPGFMYLLDVLKSRFGMLPQET
jgi:hypothetical protein